MKFKQLPFLFILLLLIKPTQVTAQKSTNKKPNVIFIYADDLGLGLLSCYGQKIIKTPNIDRIAAEGMRFDRAYGAHLCAPARASLLTGYSDCRPNKWKITQGGMHEDLTTDENSFIEIENTLNKQIGSELTQIYLPQIFKKAGYVTGQIGKLEWGFTSTTQQLKVHGWDYYYGYLDHQMCHGFYPPFLFENGQLIKIPGNTLKNGGKSLEPESMQAYQERWNRNGKSVYSEDLFIDKIKTFINNHKNEPFFLFYPSQLPHGPVSIPSIDPAFAFNNCLTTIEKEYASMVKKLDDHVGIILDELQKLKLDKNTIVVFSSDNGHEIYYSLKGRIEKPYRNMTDGHFFDNIDTKFYSDNGGDIFNGNQSLAGLKRSNWEGGARVPLLIRWPEKVSANVTSHQLVSNYDFLTTMADLLHVNVNEDKDGISYLPALLQKKSKNEHRFIAFGSCMGPALINKDGWKLRYFASKKIFQLYFLPIDPREEKDIIRKYPEIAAKMKIELLEMCEGDLSNGLYRE